MCGIVAYVGQQAAREVLIEGLKRLEYRGYDSSGIAILNDRPYLRKAVGKVAALEQQVCADRPAGSIGIAHTRWATHGKPTEPNAHPHLDCTGQIFLVHNGIIENYQVLKKHLLAAGHRFCSIVARVLRRAPARHGRRRVSVRGGRRQPWRRCDAFALTGGLRAERP